MNKNNIREEIKKNQLKPAYIHEDIYEYLINKKVGIYIPLKNELMLKLDNLDVNLLYVPYMRKYNNDLIMEYHKYTFEHTKDDLNIKSTNGEKIDINKLDVIIIPGLCYNNRGYRLGRGMGCYDKALKNYQGLMIGSCYDDNVIDYKFEEKHDIKVDLIVTNKRIIKMEK